MEDLDHFNERDAYFFTYRSTAGMIVMSESDSESRSSSPVIDITTTSNAIGEVSDDDDEDDDDDGARAAQIAPAARVCILYMLGKLRF